MTDRIDGISLRTGPPHVISEKKKNGLQIHVFIHISRKNGILYAGISADVFARLQLKKSRAKICGVM